MSGLFNRNSIKINIRVSTLNALIELDFLFMAGSIIGEIDRDLLWVFGIKKLSKSSPISIIQVTREQNLQEI
jgi:hypothetical protein